MPALLVLADRVQEGLRATLELGLRRRIRRERLRGAGGDVRLAPSEQQVEARADERHCEGDDAGKPLGLVHRSVSARTAFR